jgi:hypothetical protein
MLLLLLPMMVNFVDAFGNLLIVVALSQELCNGDK